MYFSYDGYGLSTQIFADARPALIACDADWRMAYALSVYGHNDCVMHAGRFGPLNAMRQCSLNSVDEDESGDCNVTFSHDGVECDLKFPSSLARPVVLARSGGETELLFACRPEDFTYAYGQAVIAGTPLHLTPVMVHLSPTAIGSLGAAAELLRVNFTKHADGSADDIRYVEPLHRVINNMAESVKMTGCGVAVPVSCFNAFLQLGVALREVGYDILGTDQDSRPRLLAERFHALMRVMIAYGGIELDRLVIG